MVKTINQTAVSSPTASTSGMRSHRDARQDVCADSGTAAADDVDDRAGEDTRDEQGYQGCSRDDADQRRAARAVEHEPRQDDERDPVADAGEQHTGLEQQNRAAVPPG